MIEFKTPFFEIKKTEQLFLLTFHPITLHYYLIMKYLHHYITITVGLLLLTLLLFTISCKNTLNNPSHKEIDNFFRYLDKGDSVFALKNKVENFAVSIKYFDSAAMIADKYDVDSLKAYANLFIGRAYDAWNREPQETIEYFKKARQYVPSVNRTQDQTLVDILLAHAYKKINDSANAVNTCIICDKEDMTGKDFELKDAFYVEIAYIAASFKNYPLSNQYTSKVQYPDKIKNESINFKAHQTATQVILHLHYLHTDMPAWLDSTKSIIAHCTNLSDSLYYLTFLIDSYNYLQNLDSGKKYNELAQSLYYNKFSPYTNESNSKSSFLEYELKEKEKNIAIAAIENKAKNRTLLLVLIASILMGILTFINLISRKKVYNKTKELKELNLRLDEKANQNLLLVKEMHHRVKNNLHLIYSLLEMQERRTDNPETHEQLLAAKQRIESIAITHEQLYTNNNSNINMDIYINNFMHNIISTHSDVKQLIPGIKINKSIVLKISNCLPLAMLINEWITNSVKYAIVENNQVNIFIEATVSGNTVTMTYHDSGSEISNSIEIKQGLGSKIIILLCKQIKATLITNYNNIPFHYKIEFEI